MDVSVRHLRILVAVAEHRHMAKAAAALYLSQATVSGAVRDLERRLGVDLLDRSNPSRTRLTAAGETFAADAAAILARLGDAISTAQREGGHPHGRIRVGILDREPHALPRLIIRAFIRRFPSVATTVVGIPWLRGASSLLEGRIDVAFLRLPRVPRLAYHVIAVEPRVAILADDHRLRGMPQLELADLADEPVLQHLGADVAWAAFWTGHPRPGGRSAPIGPPADGPEAALAHIAAGRAIGFAPADMAPDLHRWGIGTVPVVDLPASELAVAHRRTTDDPLVAAFVGVAREVATADPAGSTAAGTPGS